MKLIHHRPRGGKLNFGKSASVYLSPLGRSPTEISAAAVHGVFARSRVEGELRRRVTDLEAQVADLDAARQWAEQRIQTREQARSEAAEQYQAVFESTPIGIATTTPDMRFLKANASFCEMTGYSGLALEQQRLPEITHPDDLAVDASLLTRLLTGALDSYSVEKRFRRRDGRVIRVALTVAVKRDRTGEAHYLVLVAQDISRRKLNEQKLAEAQLRLQLAVEIGRLGFWEWEPETGGTYFSPEWKQQLGILGDELPVAYDDWKSWLHPDDREHVLNALRSCMTQPDGEYLVEYRMRHRDGSYRWFMSRNMALQTSSGKVGKLIGIRLDVTERKEAEQSIREASQHDPLTGLPNRALLADHAEHILAAAHRSRTGVAIFFIDLDRFKEINDMHGHEAGDAVLRAVADRLSASVRKGDIIGRLGGDEFLAILSDVKSVASAASVAEHVLANLNKSYPVGHLELLLTPSIGVAMFPADGDDLDTLIRRADRAMYVAKESGGSRIQFSQELVHQSDTARTFEAQLRSALERGEFELYLQPITSLHTAEVCGAEALLRWHRQANELLLPDQFMPVAKASGVIGELGEWAFRSGCRLLLQLLQQHLPRMVLAINVSPVDFRQSNFSRRLAALVHDGGIAPDSIQIELRESVVMQSFDAALRTLHEVRALGVRVVLDHFGQGNCGIGALSRLPVDTVKIDQMFVRTLGQGGNSEAVIDAAIALGRALGLRIVAEGVESEKAIKFLRDHGCEFGQGFALGMPMAVGDFEQWYRAHLH